MSAQSNAPVIIKKVKKVSGGGHHGGAWKVAYADFVTAMMAFFMLMWLLNATTEKQRKGIADYFSPTIPIMRASGGGDGAFGGDSVFTSETLAHNGTGGLDMPAGKNDIESPPAAGNGGNASLEQIEQTLTGNSGDSMVSDIALRHVNTELTDEGLIIDMHDLEGDPLFFADSSEPTPVLRELVAMLAEVFGVVTNGVAVEGYVAAQPVVVANNTSWSLSAARADRMRRMLQAAGMAPARLKRVTGHADRDPAMHNLMSVRNNRLKVVLLRNRR